MVELVTETVKWIVIFFPYAVVFLVLFAVFYPFYAYCLQKEKESCRQDYLSSLRKLSNDPTNPLLRREALAKGRCYIEAEKKLNPEETTFGEARLSNDIEAACAGASEHQPTQGNKTPEQRMADLDNLRNSKMISDEEYKLKRKEILDSI